MHSLYKKKKKCRKSKDLKKEYYMSAMSFKYAVDCTKSRSLFNRYLCDGAHLRPVFSFN